MIVKEVRSYTISLPLDIPIYTSNTTIRQRDFVFVEIETENGLKGCGYGFARDGLIAECITKNLRPLLLGQDALLTEKLWDEMYMNTRYLGRKGMMMRAISAVDIALWDLKGKLAGLPLWKLLGGHDNKVKAYVAGGYYRENQSIDELKKEFLSYREQQFHGAKINVGGLSMKEDLERIQAVRSAIGENMELMVDFNGVLTSAKQAEQFARRVEPYQIKFIEEPFLMDNLSAMQELRARTPIPIAIGEDESGRWPFKEMMVQHCLDIVRHDATLVGGISEWVKVAHLAQAFRIPIFAHWFPEIHIHLASAFPSGIGIELIAPESGTMNFHYLVHNPVKQQNGCALAPEEPGLGLNWNWEAIERAIR
ncbi:mandelate racemase/muconate lactonizing enzyme family protein [Paenibacillus sp. GCM10027626]|uniref:mandelate racemase/muconate lactonizing enzyme family protein n=1 Tax=Paenibacillus sp. GCM10027626 TaxID=3273411 RepID=UPI0036250198